MNRRTRTIFVLMLALGVAAAASFVVYRAIQRIPVRQVEVANYHVVVAAKPLAMGTRLAATDLKLIAWPKSSPVNKGFTDITAVVERGLLSAMVENEPVTENKLAPTQAGAGLPPIISAGMRAMSVKVNEVVGVAGYVVPGSRVDLLVTIRRDKDSLTRTVATNIQVLTAGTAYDQEKAKDGEAMPSTVVTLMVTPEDAERIALAASQGQVMLSLRNPLDTANVATTGQATANLLGHSAAPEQPKPAAPAGRRTARPTQTPPPPAPVVAAKPNIVESIKGGKRTTEELKEVKEPKEAKAAKENNEVIR